jgi:hypothetical protein
MKEVAIGSPLLNIISENFLQSVENKNLKTFWIIDLFYVTECM